MTSGDGTVGGRRRAVFLDRDGTINVEVDFLGDPAGVELIPGSARGLALLREAGFALVVVSNQSGVARGFFGEDAVKAVNARLSEMLEAEGVSIDAFHYCPHHPEADLEEYRRDCDCRKPGAGLIDAAAKRMGIDVAGSYTVGDSGRDLVAGRRAGTKAVLVLTGHTSREDVEGWDFTPDRICADLLEACIWIVEDSSGGVSDG